LAAEDYSEGGPKAVISNGFMHVLTKNGKYVKVKITDNGGLLQKDQVE
jgi:hypothetical protein